ncbi:MAG: histidine kinase [Bacteroidales bacterium]|nr:histidine kinase [Bacteroidales bacterium]
MYRINHTLIFLALCFALWFSFFQSGISRDDKFTETDTALINRINEKAFSLYKTNPDSAFVLVRRSLRLSREANYSKGVADAYKTLAYTHLLNFSRNDSARYYFTKAFELYKILDDQRGMGVVYYGLGYLYNFNGDMDQSENSMRKGLSIFQEINDARGMFNVYHALAYLCKERKDYDMAYEYIDLAIKYANQINDVSSQADLYNTKGNIFKDQAMFEHAIDMYFKALKFWETANDSSGMAIAYGSIAEMYYLQKDYKKALQYLNNKLPVSIKMNNNWEVSKSYNSIASVYNARQKYDSSLLYLKKGLQLNLMMNYPSGIADSYYNLAKTYYLMAAIDSAIFYADKSIIIARNIYDRAKLSEYYVLRGKIHLKAGNNKTALQDLQKGYEIARELDIPFVISDASKLLSKIYASKNNYKVAYHMLMEHKLLDDSLNKDENIKKITQMELQYEFDKKQRKAELMAEKERLANKAAMKQQRIYIIGLSVILIFLLLLGILILRQKNLQVKFKTIELEQKLLRTQMNPHFIFNSLCAIQDYMYSNNAKVAGDFLSRFAALMRQILENSRAEYVTIDKEVSMLTNYLEIQKLRFERKFIYEIDVDPSIDTEIFAIPPMLTQPFIENAIEHGLLPKKGKGKIMIRFQLQNKLLTIDVEDNGIGREKTENQKEEHQKTSLSTILTTERLAYLKNQTGKDISFFIYDLKKNGMPSGTRVTFRVPYQRIYN